MMTSLSFRIIALSLGVAVVAPGLTVQAAVTAPADDESRDIVELDAQANAAYQAGAFESAAGLFVDLYQRTKDPNYLYNASVCYDRVGRLPEALDALNQYAAESPEHDEAAVASKRRGLEIRIESEGRDSDEPPKDESLEDDGAHEVATGPVPVDDAKVGRSKPLDIAGGVALGLGVTGLAVGIGLGVASNNNKSDVEAGCVQGDGGLVCSEAEHDANDRAKSFALGADIAIIGGGALVAAGVALLVVNTVRAKKGRNVAFTPTVGPRMSGLSVAGRF